MLRWCFEPRYIIMGTSRVGDSDSDSDSDLDSDLDSDYSLLLGVAHIASALWVRRRAAAGCEATDATR